MKRYLWTLLVLTLGAARASAAGPEAGPAHALTLAGTWRFQLDPADAGHAEGWFARELPDSIYLPGTTDEAHVGVRATEPAKGHLTREWSYVGPAWFQREVAIPESWTGKRVELFLERCHWQTEVWVDEAPQGMRNSLVAPHTYDLTTALTPGKHRLTICVDNTYRINVGGWAHSVTDETQTNWNGIIGRIELRATDPLWIDSLAAYPSLTMHGISARVTLRSEGMAAATGALVARIVEPGSGSVLAQWEQPVRLGAEGEQTLEGLMELPSAAPQWDEWEGNVLRLEATLEATGDGRSLRDTRAVDVGLREFGARGTQFTLNGRPFFVRGNLECCIFPLTGHPPMDAAEWDRVFGLAREYGLNNVRFHSWCPPEAAFDAADRAGMTMQVELPVWTSVGTDPKVDDFMRAEGQRILEAYGSHPSFTMLCLGNELSGDFGVMDAMVEEFQAADPRHLYTFASDCNRLEPGPVSDYLEGYATKAGPIRINGDGAHFASGPTTDYDYASRLAPLTVPFIAHELGQWVTYPSYDEVGSYTGVLKPRSLEGFRQTLADHGMLDQARAFENASGKLAWLLYKEEMETLYRTPRCGGFQLLSLQDFPGQSEALVGLLDSRWRSKGILTPREMRRFCAPTVALARLPRFVWRSGETLTARAEVAHYGKEALQAVPCSWSLRDQAFGVVAGGDFGPKDLPLGEVTTLGEVSAPLSSVREAKQLTLTVRAGEVENSWDVWVYPDAVDESVPAGVTVASEWGEDVAGALARGERVALLLPRGFQGERAIATRFLPVFWSFAMFAGQNATDGLLCDPAHPALAGFPTQHFANWQWWELLEGACYLDLTGTPEALRPVVQGIDDFHRNLKLGAVLECRVGEGKLLVSSLDLTSDLDKRPVARQLRRSLLDYAAGDRFQPTVSLEPDLAAGLVRTYPPLPTVTEPVGLDRAVLRLTAAGKLTESKVSRPWSAELDEVLARAEGFDYAVNASGVWLDETDSAWHGGRMEVDVTVPRGFAGTLYVRWHDWNRNGRRGIVRCEGIAYRLEDHAAGLWSALEVTPADTADGTVSLSSETLAGPNLMITDLALVPR